MSHPTEGSIQEHYFTKKLSLSLPAGGSIQGHLFTKNCLCLPLRWIHPGPPFHHKLSMYLPTRGSIQGHYFTTNYICLFLRGDPSRDTTSPQNVSASYCGGGAIQGHNFTTNSLCLTLQWIHPGTPFHPKLYLSLLVL